jgi:uncharacterized damage-inducible protein DinB
MSRASKQSYVITPLRGYDLEIGRWLWALEDTRRATLKAVKDIAPGVIDWMPPHGDNSIGTLLYHIAAIETDWLYMEVLEQEQFPPEVAALFLYDVRDSEGRLTPIQGIGIEEHLQRLAAVRALLLDAFHGMDEKDFYVERNFEQYDVTPEWVVYHLIRHESEHQGQIVQLRKIAERALVP